MKLQSPAPRSAPSDDNLIPMINVVFLLLIFFMVAGTIRPSDPLPIDAPLTLSGTAPKTLPVLYIHTSGAMVLNETPLAADQLAEMLARLSATPASHLTTDDGLNSSIANSADLSLIPSLAIKADAETPMALLRQVLEVARVAGIHSVELITHQTSTPP